MAMDPRTHPRGAPPDFSMAGLPPNPNPQRITNALWWLVQMRLRLEPLSENGGVLAIKPGYHSYGSRLEDHGLNNSETDHSIRRAPDRAGPWWRDFAAAHDWTFDRAHSGNYTEINKYMRRRVNAMQSLTDLRPDDVYAYTIGNLDGDLKVEGWNEYKDAPETGNDTHLWHIHDAFRRNIIGLFSAMWKALTIDMGWTYAEWQRSVAPQPAPEETMDWNDKVEQGTVGDTGGDWRTFRHVAADLQNRRNWDYASEDSTAPVNPPPAASRAVLLHSRVKTLAEDVASIKSQAASNGTGISQLTTRLNSVEAKLDQILAKLESPPPA